MLREESILDNMTNDVATEHLLTLLKVRACNEVPLLCLVELVHLNTSRDEDTLGDLSDGLEGTLNTVENVVEDTY